MKRFGLATGLIIIWASLLPFKVLALSKGETSGTIVSAHIAGVRLVLLNNQGKIVEIQSNTESSIEPRFFKGSYDQPLAEPSAFVRLEYERTISDLDTKHRGKIYSLKSDIPNLVFSYLSRYISSSYGYFVR